MMDIVMRVFEYSLGCSVGVSIIAIFLLVARNMWGNKLSKRFVYGLWIAIPVFMLVSPWMELPAPEVVQELSATVKSKIVETKPDDRGTDNKVSDNSGSNNGDTDSGMHSQSSVTNNSDKEQEPVKPAVDHNNDKVTDVSDANTSDINTSDTEVATNSVPDAIGIREILGCIYVAVVMVLLAALTYVNVRFALQCRGSRSYVCSAPDIGLVVYKIEGIHSPFLFGRNIYIPNYVIDDEELKYAILHEKCHYTHGDGIWIFVRYLVLVLNFYNPIIWFANKYVGRDCELACDEAVMKRIAKGERKTYGGCLLSTIERKQSIGQSALLATHMKGGKKLMKERIENIAANYKRSIIVTCLTAILLMVVAGCSLMKGGATDVDTEETIKPHTIGEFIGLDIHFQEYDTEEGEMFGYREHIYIDGLSYTEFDIDIDCEASSVLKSKDSDCYAKYVGDYYRTTAWSEGVEGDGIGEYINLEIKANYQDDPRKVKYEGLCIVTGNAHDDTSWQENNRAKKLKFYYNGDYKGTIELQDTMKPQYIDIKHLELASDNDKSAEFKFEIAEVYEGTAYNNTYISGIAFDYDYTLYETEWTEAGTEESTEAETMEKQKSESGEFYPLYNGYVFSSEDYAEPVVPGINSKYTMPENWNYTFDKINIGEYFARDEAWNVSSNPAGTVFGFEEGMSGGCSSWCGTEFYTHVATASSTLPAAGKVTYKADNLLDGDRGTVWCEGVKGDGIGESITITQKYKGGPYLWNVYEEICIVNGYAYNETTWMENNRVKKMKLYFGDTYVGSFTLQDTMKPQYIDISALKMKVVTDTEAKFRLEIEEVYEGLKYDDTCITGIIFEFQRDAGH